MAGSACARFPPTVARLRTSGSAITSAVSWRIGYFDLMISERSSADSRVRPIRKGRLGKPVEFGYKAQIVDNADGVILDHNVEIGNPPDVDQVACRADTKLEQRQQALAARQHLGLIAMALQERDRLR